MEDAREKLRAWQIDYNHCRPHRSLGNLTPSEYVKMRSGNQIGAARL
jgi:putative transposase